ncbi:hypothetical protein M413DRAFT_166173 [Hebeloma cylindrosporum]|uniref:Uncharacterized protein n=1 Tax=Hebeloma cylindrosporum TaxID=76867 RepID=A0A0C3CAR4_HEBCY|nr:hypothetical protein M413DRAFT_166173 [Hebeloma cylindrosporum h7]
MIHPSMAVDSATAFTTFSSVRRCMYELTGSKLAARLTEHVPSRAHHPNPSVDGSPYFKKKVSNHPRKPTYNHGQPISSPSRARSGKKSSRVGQEELDAEVPCHSNGP